MPVNGPNRFGHCNRGGSAVATIEQWDYVKRDLDDWKVGWRDGLDYLTVHDNFFTGRGNMAFSFGVKSCVVVQTVGLSEALAKCLVEDLLDENGPDEASWVFEKAWLLNEMDRLMTFIRDSLKGRGYYTCDLEAVAATERKLEESCDRLEDILLFTGTVGQARIRRVCRRWGTIIHMSYISKCLNVQVPDIWTTVSSWKIRMLSKGLSVMVMEHTHAITFIRLSVRPSVRPSVHPSVRSPVSPTVHPPVRPTVRQPV
ncbi:hypothetical protein BV898_05700 [Hypsibius exemplaris]|uniref:Uncharacterized protein n=1 Tax=Hypsibius exemplaris TaxID=2072580 RepID=A0A1W0WYY0_HYPEX|nr:hypothetical protein BV898_05700 [Hypsibius exemplaris]